MLLEIVLRICKLTLFLSKSILKFTESTNLLQNRKMGKPYTMKEKKQIITYLLDHRAYGQVRGRQMWTDMAASPEIHRTWQSLKETFLKRILPEIHDPYYQLTRQQIQSFKQEYDTASNTKNKLEIQTISDESSDTAKTREDIAKPSTSKDIGENKAGEDIQCSKIQSRRSSTDTLVLEPCYGNAEEILRELESPTETNHVTLKDLITYSEPLTPMLQEVLHDFASDDDDEPQLQIVENIVVVPELHVQKDNKRRSNSPIELQESQSILAQKKLDSAKVNEDVLLNGNHEDNRTGQCSKIKSLRLKKTHKGTWEYKETNEDNLEANNNTKTNCSESQNITVSDIRDNNSEITNAIACDPKEKSTKDIKTAEVEKSTESVSNSTPDTLLPNNQEEFNKNTGKRASDDFSSLEVQKSTENKNCSQKRSTRIGPKSTQSTSITKRKLRGNNQLKPNSKADVLEEDTKQSQKPVMDKEDIANHENDIAPDNLNDLQISVKESDKNTPYQGNTSQAAGPSTSVNDNVSLEINPCFNSVSLFAEQFSTAKYSDSESSVEKVTKGDKAKEKPGTSFDKTYEVEKQSELPNETKSITEGNDNSKDNINQEANKLAATFGNEILLKSVDEVVVLKSYSDSDSELVESRRIKKWASNSVLDKSQRDKGLANVFGFSWGGATRKRTISNREGMNRRYSRHNGFRHRLHSSDTSVSDEDDCPPLRRRKNSDARKQPIFATSKHMSRRGQLYVAGKKRPYPPVMFRGNTQTYLAIVDSYSDDTFEEFVWKRKYLEEKEKRLQEEKKRLEEMIRADELSRLLKEAQQRREVIEVPCSPILMPKLSTSSTPKLPDKIQPQASKDKENAAEVITIEDTEKLEEKPKDKRLKLKFTKNNEIELECQLSQFDCILDKMADYYKKTEAKVEGENPKPLQIVIEPSKEKVAEADDKDEKVNKVESKQLNQQQVATQPTPEEISFVVARTNSDVLGQLYTAVVQEVVQRKEDSIFKEIEALDKSLQMENEPEVNVTKRKLGRQKKILSSSSSASLQGDAKRISTRKATDDVQENIKLSSSSSASMQEDPKRRSTRKATDDVQENIKLSSSSSASMQGGAKRRSTRRATDDVQENNKLSLSSSASLQGDEKRSTRKATDDVQENNKLSLSSSASLQGDEKRSTRKATDDVQENNKLSSSSSASLQGDANIRSTRKANNDVQENNKSNNISETEVPIETSNVTTKRNRRPAKKIGVDIKGNLNKTAKFKARSRSALSTRSKRIVAAAVVSDEDSEVRYKFPQRQARHHSRPSTKVEQADKNYFPKKPRPFSSPGNTSRHSIDSTQGYQDSDLSPAYNPLKKKRKSNLMSLEGNLSGYKIRRKSYPYLADDDTNSNQLFSPPSNSAAPQNSSLDTAVYRSESYQLLAPTHRISSGQLIKINEANTTPNVRNILSPLTINVIDEIQIQNNSGGRSVRENSSNVSLPMSPELSIVENISFTKNKLSSSGDHPSINETQINDIITEEESLTSSHKYVISDIDIAVPLMEQDCELRKTKEVSERYSETKEATVTKSLLSQIGSVNLEDPSASDTLNQKLQDLLLESAKKIAKQTNQQHNIDAQDKENVMEVDTPSNEQKKTRSKKRCSTPCKKKEPKKCKPNVEPLVEEEHMESCSFSGRTLPTINIVNIEDVDVDIEDKLNNDKQTDTKRTSRKKKDVIKVKILRPREKSLKKENRVKRARSSGRLSICTDSGINDTESKIFPQGCNDSVELIHNHSETCLQTHDCLTSSVEFIDTTKSVVMLDSNSEEEGRSLRDAGESSERVSTPELFCDNAQDATSLTTVKFKSLDEETATGETVYATPASNLSISSLMTEDLSSDYSPPPQIKPSRWYLLSEDETTNTNFYDTRSQGPADLPSVGANLKQIFPITCAVPNLSTISELSRENESRKTSTNSPK